MHMYRVRVAIPSLELPGIDGTMPEEIIYFLLNSRLFINTRDVTHQVLICTLLMSHDKRKKSNDVT